MKFYIGLVMALLVTGCSKNPPDCNDSEAKELVISAIKNKLSQPFDFYEAVYEKGALKEIVDSQGQGPLAIGLIKSMSKNNSPEQDKKIGIYKLRVNLAEFMDFEVKQVKLIDLDEKIGYKTCSANVEAKISDKNIESVAEILEQQLKEIKYYLDSDYAKGTEKGWQLDRWEKVYSFILMAMETDKNNMINTLQQYKENPWRAGISYKLEKVDDSDFDATVSYN